MALRGTPETAKRAQEARRAKTERDRLYQESLRAHVGTVMLQPAIGKTGGADNVGWEMYRPGEVPQYYATKEQDEQAARKWLAHDA